MYHKSQNLVGGGINANTLFGHCQCANANC